MSHSSKGPGPRELRRMLVRHNWHVLFLAVSTVFVAAAGWALVYGAMYWALLIALTLAKGAEAVAPPPFLSRFVSIGIVVCALLWLTRKRGAVERPRDSKSPFEVFMDFALALPRTTLAAWDTLFAFQFLDEKERSLAWRLLQRLDKTPALPAYALPQELPDPDTRQKILMALQLTGLITFRWQGEDLMLILCEEPARQVLGGTVRIRLRR